jgi:hypothetical protein
MSWYQLTMHANYKCRLSIDSSLSVHNEIRDDPELPDDNGKAPKPNGMVGSSIPDHEIVSLLDEKLAKWPSASCTCVPKKEKKKKRKKKKTSVHNELGLL